AVVAVLLFLITFATTRERVHPPANQQSDLRAELGLLFRNTPWKVMSISGILILANVAVRGAVTVHFFKYVVGDTGEPFLFGADFTTFFMTSGMLAMIAGVACTPLFVKLAGKRELMIWLSLGNALGMAAIFFISADHIWLIVITN